jgi:hypothetical protein
VTTSIPSSRRRCAIVAPIPRAAPVTSALMAPHHGALNLQSYSLRLTRPGTYRLFCSLHPVEMTEVVTVR